MLFKVSIPILNEKGDDVSNQEVYFDSPDGVPPTKDEVVNHLQEVIEKNTIPSNAIVDWFETTSRENIVRVAKESIKSINAPGTCGYDKWPGVNECKYIERDDLEKFAYVAITIQRIPVKVLIRD